MSNLKELVATTWESYFGRFVVLALTLGWVPCLLLGKAHAALTCGR